MKAVTYRHDWSSKKTEEEEMAGLFGLLLVEFDTSEAYEQESSHLFKNKDKYVWIDANGCSCWDGDYDGWELTLSELKKLAKKALDNRYEGRDRAGDLVAEWVLKNL